MRIFLRRNVRLYNFKPQQRAELEGDELAHYKKLYVAQSVPTSRTD